MVVLDGAEEAAEETRGEITGGLHALRPKELSVEALTVFPHSDGLIHCNLSDFTML